MLKQLRSLFGGKQPPAADPRELFTAEVEAFVRSLPPVQAVKHVPDAFALDVVTTAGARRAYLDNAFAESREMSPEERRAKIAFFFAFVGDQEQNETWDEARETLVPVLRGATYGLEIWAQEPKAGFVRRPFLPFVDIVVAMDRPTSMSFVGRGTVERWKLEEREVFEAAAGRVHLLGDKSVDLYDDTHGSLWVVTSNDSYESSRLLVPGWLAAFRGRVEGNPIAIIPERATLMVGGDGRPEMIERLLDKAEREFAASNRRLSPALYTIDEAGKVVPYNRPESDVLATKAKIAHLNLGRYEYGVQKTELDKLYEATGHDVYVASYDVLRARDGTSPRSFSVWTRGVRTYLPETEKVMLLITGDEGGKPKAVVEARFEAIRDRLTPVPDVHPARFETTGEFPSDDELRSLGKLAVATRPASSKRALARDWPSSSATPKDNASSVPRGIDTSSTPASPRTPSPRSSASTGYGSHLTTARFWQSLKTAAPVPTTVSSSSARWMTISASSRGRRARWSESLSDHSRTRRTGTFCPMNSSASKSPATTMRRSRGATGSPWTEPFRSATKGAPSATGLCSRATSPGASGARRDGGLQRLVAVHVSGRQEDDFLRMVHVVA